jgi:pimeloyl-ACP methyl ester carboxylesterase
MEACASLPDVRIREIQDRRVSYASIGAGTPTLIFESGLGVSMSTWLPIFEPLGKITKVFAYDRPGYGKSNKQSIPETAGDIAEQLHENLVETGHAPPYLLVGHSAGGLYVNVFARTYPEEVAGVVLIDSTHPSQFEYFRDEQPLLYSMLIASTSTSKVRYESTILMKVNDEFKELNSFPEIPLVVLTAEKSSMFEIAKMQQKWLEFQNDLGKMSSRSVQMVVQGSGHFIHQDKPEIVVDEIKKMIYAIRMKR